jgi:hypothetical protein
MTTTLEVRERADPNLGRTRVSIRDVWCTPRVGERVRLRNNGQEYLAEVVDVQHSFDCESGVHQILVEVERT